MSHELNEQPDTQAQPVLGDFEMASLMLQAISAHQLLLDAQYSPETVEATVSVAHARLDAPIRAMSPMPENSTAPQTEGKVTSFSPDQRRVVMSALAYMVLTGTSDKDMQQVDGPQASAKRDINRKAALLTMKQLVETESVDGNFDNAHVSAVRGGEPLVLNRGQLSGQPRVSGGYRARHARGRGGKRAVLQ